MSKAGLTLLIADVRRDASGPLFPPLPASEHWLSLSVTFVDTKQDHDVIYPNYISDFISDENGPDQEGYSVPGGFVELRLPIAAGCGQGPAASPGGGGGGGIMPPQVHLHAGDRYGPIQLCYIVAGPPHQRIVIHWSAWQAAPNSSAIPTGGFSPEVDLTLP